MEAPGCFGSFHCLAAALSVQAGCQALCCTHPVDRHLPAHAESLPGMDDTVRAQQGTQGEAACCAEAPVSKTSVPVL